MNVSQQDTYNLSWKIAGVLRGQLDPSVLSTYKDERLLAAHELMQLDKEMTRILTSRAAFDFENTEKVYQMVRKSNGTHLKYGPSTILASLEECQQSAAANIPLGIRLPNATVYTHSNGVETSTQSLLTSDGSWRLLVFGGNVSQPGRLKYINGLGDKFSQLANKYPCASPRLQHWLQILLFHSSNIYEVESAQFHDAYFQPHPVYGRNYFTIFGDDSSRGKLPGAHETYGIGDKGALVVVRPDQFVAWMGTLEETEKMEAWFAKFMMSETELNGARA